VFKNTKVRVVSSTLGCHSNSWTSCWVLYAFATRIL